MFSLGIIIQITIFTRYIRKCIYFIQKASLIYLSQYDLKCSLTWENAFGALRLSYTTSLSLAITLRSTHTPELHKITQKACNIMIYRCLEDTDCVEPGSWGVGVHNSPRLSLTNAAPKISTRRKGGWKNPHQCKWDPRTWWASLEEKKTKHPNHMLSPPNLVVTCDCRCLLTQESRPYPWISLQSLKNTSPHSGCHKRK